MPNSIILETYWLHRPLYLPLAEWVYWFTVLLMIVHLEKLFNHSVDRIIHHLLTAASQAVLNTFIQRCRNRSFYLLWHLWENVASAPQCDRKSILDNLVTTIATVLKRINILSRFPLTILLLRKFMHWPCYEHNPVLSDQKGGNRLMDTPWWWDISLSHFI